MMVFICMLWGLFSAAAAAITTVDVLEPTKYTGRWYQVYSDEFDLRFMKDATCVTADYELDEETGHILVTNSDRKGDAAGALEQISGYAYVPDLSKPGQLKVHLGDIPQDGDYWVISLGPEVNGLYAYAIVTDSTLSSLFVLCRDVDAFATQYEAEVLQFLELSGFTGESNSPVPTYQSSKCLYPEAELALQLAPGLKLGGGSSSGSDSSISRENKGRNFGKGIETVDEVDLEKYEGRWFQVYGDRFNSLFMKGAACVTADYTIVPPPPPTSPNDTATVPAIAVVNSDRKGGPAGPLEQITGLATVPHPDTAPGKLTVSLEGVPIGGDYWIVKLGPVVYGLYDYAVVTDRFGLTLFVLARSMDRFVYRYNHEVVGWLKEAGFDGYLNTPQLIDQSVECVYPKREGEMGENEGENEENEESEAGEAVSPEEEPASAVALAHAFAAMQDRIESLPIANTDTDSSTSSSTSSSDPTTSATATAAVSAGAVIARTVPSLQLDAYTGRWFQAYASLSVMATIEVGGTKCVCGDYGAMPAPYEKNNITVFNQGRAVEESSEANTAVGYAYIPNEEEPGQLKVHFYTPSVPAIPTTTNPTAPLSNAAAGDDADAADPTAKGEEAVTGYGAISGAEAGAKAKAKAGAGAGCGGKGHLLRGGGATTPAPPGQGVGEEGDKDGEIEAGANAAGSSDVTDTVGKDSFEGDYWIYALGPVLGGQYQYSIVSDPLQFTLFLLVRDLDTFKDQYEEEALAKAKGLGFDQFWNAPMRTDHPDWCSYLDPPPPPEMKILPSGGLAPAGKEMGGGGEGEDGGEGEGGGSVGRMAQPKLSGMEPFGALDSVMAMA